MNVCNLNVEPQTCSAAQTHRPEILPVASVWDQNQQLLVPSELIGCQLLDLGETQHAKERSLFSQSVRCNTADLGSVGPNPLGRSVCFWTDFGLDAPSWASLHVETTECFGLITDPPPPSQQPFIGDRAIDSKDKTVVLLGETLSNPVLRVDN